MSGGLILTSAMNNSQTRSFHECLFWTYNIELLCLGKLDTNILDTNILIDHWSIKIAVTSEKNNPKINNNWIVQFPRLNSSY